MNTVQLNFIRSVIMSNISCLSCLDANYFCSKVFSLSSTDTILSQIQPGDKTTKKLPLVAEVESDEEFITVRDPSRLILWTVRLSQRACVTSVEDVHFKLSFKTPRSKGFVRNVFKMVTFLLLDRSSLRTANSRRRLRPNPVSGPLRTSTVKTE